MTCGISSGHEWTALHSLFGMFNLITETCSLIVKQRTINIDVNKMKGEFDWNENNSLFWSVFIPFGLIDLVTGICQNSGLFMSVTQGSDWLMEFVPVIEAWANVGNKVRSSGHLRWNAQDVVSKNSKRKKKLQHKQNNYLSTTWQDCCFFSGANSAANGPLENVSLDHETD